MPPCHPPSCTRKAAPFLPSSVCSRVWPPRNPVPVGCHFLADSPLPVCSALTLGTNEWTAKNRPVRRLELFYRFRWGEVRPVRLVSSHGAGKTANSKSLSIHDGLIGLSCHSTCCRDEPTRSSRTTRKTQSRQHAPPYIANILSEERRRFLPPLIRAQTYPSPSHCANESRSPVSPQ